MTRDAGARADALDQIAAIARRHGLSVAEIEAALATGPAAAPARESRRRGVLVRVLAFLGGTFVFAGLGLFIALQWEHLNAGARIVLTLGSGGATFALAVLASRDARFARAAAPLFLMAAALEPGGMFVAFAELGSGGDWRLASLVTTATMAIQFGIAVWTLGRTTAVFVTLLFTVLFWWTAFDLLDVDGEATAIVIGGAIVLAAAGLDRTRHADVTPFWYFTGAVALLAGLFGAVEGSIVEVVFLGAAAGFVYLATLVHSRTLLLVATVAILGYTGWFTAEHFADSIGWPLALIVFGMAMIGLSAVAFRIDRTYVRVPHEPGGHHN